MLCLLLLSATGDRSHLKDLREKSLMLSQNLYNDYKSRTGARKLIDKMMKAGLIEKVGERNNTLYKTKK